MLFVIASIIVIYFLANRYLPLIDCSDSSWQLELNWRWKAFSEVSPPFNKTKAQWVRQV